MTREIMEASLSECIAIMDIPSGRKPINKDNLNWMSRNLGVKNSNHPKFHLAMMYIRNLININKINL